MNADSFRTRARALVEPLKELPPRREAVATLLLGAETAIVYLFAGTLLATGEFPHKPLPVLLIFSMLTFARIIPHLLETMRIWNPEFEIVMSVSIVLSMAAIIKLGAFPGEPLFSLSWIRGAVDAMILRENDSIRTVWLLVAFTGYAWWRGRTRAEPTLESGYNMLRLGIVWLAAGLILTMVVAPPGSTIFGSINLAIVAFLILTLLAIAIARQPEAEQSPAEGGGWVWLLIFAVPILAISGAAFSSVEILTRDTLDLVLTILGPVFWLIRVMLQAMVLAVAVIAFLLISPVIWLLERQGFRPLSNLPNINLSPGGQFDPNSFANSTLQIENPIRYLVAGLILLALLWFLVRFAYRRRRIWTDGGSRHRDDLIDWDEPELSLLQLVRRWIEGRLGTRMRYAWPDGPDWEATRRIRRTYLRFLRVNRHRDAGRNPEETPSRFAERISSIDARSADEIKRLTSRYNQARYSGQPAQEIDASDAEAAYEAFLNQLEAQDNDMST